MSEKNNGKQNKVRPGKFIIEPPTLISLGFEWYIEGDDNRNATVEVWYREKGDNDWKRLYLFFESRMKRILPSF